ncbi:MAG: D-2-hydroxyacid dehydrogenase [Oscillospiraceae bacterium]|jgi:glycerate dehydrogenase|nr:D-2-hydroxyacid dehydrogenase [Oscillospiraceae bacterium]
MKIVILDGHTTNPGDLSWGEIARLGELTVYDHTPADQTLARAAGAELVLSNKTLLGAAEIAALPTLRYIGLLSTGYNVVDLAAASARGIAVTNIPAYGTPAVTQMVFALLLELTNHAAGHSLLVRQGEWASCRDFCFWRWPLMELQGKTLGVVGFGQIGRAVAAVALAFGMRVLACDKTLKDQPDGASLVSLEELLAASDVVSLHCPLTEETKELINRSTLARMKPGALLINTARGPLLREQDVADALTAGTLGGLGVDVLSVEPPDPDNPLLRAPNCVITPHIAWATAEARTRLIAIAADNLRAFLAGEPQNRVNA